MADCGHLYFLLFVVMLTSICYLTHPASMRMMTSMRAKKKTLMMIVASAMLVGYKRKQALPIAMKKEMIPMIRKMLGIGILTVKASGGEQTFDKRTTSCSTLVTHI